MVKFAIFVEQDVWKMEDFEICKQIPLINIYTLQWMEYLVRECFFSVRRITCISDAAEFDLLCFHLFLAGMVCYW